MFLYAYLGRNNRPGPGKNSWGFIQAGNEDSDDVPIDILYAREKAKGMKVMVGKYHERSMTVTILNNNIFADISANGSGSKSRSLFNSTCLPAIVNLNFLVVLVHPARSLNKATDSVRTAADSSTHRGMFTNPTIMFK